MGKQSKAANTRAEKQLGFTLQLYRMQANSQLSDICVAQRQLCISLRKLRLRQAEIAQLRKAREEMTETTEGQDEIPGSNSGICTPGSQYHRRSVTSGSGHSMRAGTHGSRHYRSVTPGSVHVDMADLSRGLQDSARRRARSAPARQVALPHPPTDPIQVRSTRIRPITSQVYRTRTRIVIDTTTPARQRKSAVCGFPGRNISEDKSIQGQRKIIEGVQGERKDNTMKKRSERAAWY